MSDVKISVIIPVYRIKEEYLRECLHSVLHQTLQEIEILLVDDGVTDEIAAILDHYASVDKRVHVFKQEHAGASAARNTGIKNAVGKYITFVDSDDHIAEDNLKAVFSFAEKNELEVAVWGTYKCFPDRMEEYMPFIETIPLLNERLKRDLMLKTMAGDLPVYDRRCTPWGSGACCAKLYLREYLNREKIVYPVGIERSEDVNFNIRAFDKADRIGYLHRFFYYYRQLADSATYRYRDGGIAVFEKALHALKEFLDENHKPELFYQVYYMRCIYFLLSGMDMDYLHPDNEKPLRKRLLELKDKMGEEPFRSAAASVDLKELPFAKRIPVILTKHRLAAVMALFYTVYKRMGTHAQISDPKKCSSSIKQRQ